MTRSRNSLLCPNCRRLISRDERACPYCGLGRPGSWWKSAGVSLGGGPDRLIRFIVWINAGMYILSLVLEPGGTARSVSPLSVLSPGQGSLLLLGATGTYPLDRLHMWWSLVTASYLHGGILHILFNMMALRQIAPLVTQEYGVSRLVVIYTLGGVAGYVVSYFAGIPFTIGASAAVCALIGALLYYGLNRGGSYGQAVFRMVGGWVIGLFLFGLLVPGINNWAHGGGIAGGAVLGLVLGYDEKRRETVLHRTFGGICLVGTLAALAWSVSLAVITIFKQ
jgi:rhomboid protease GluP